MRTIGVVTGARSDYGIYRPLLRRIQQHPDLQLSLYVTGMHLSPEFGLTWREIERDHYPIAAKIESLLSSDTPQGIATSMGIGTAGFAQAFGRCRPDMLVVLGDRFEMHAAVVAAVPFLIPVAHIAGGAVTVGAIDDALRHSITKLSHLHFAETEEYANRLIQMGEEPWRVTVSGALSLDEIERIEWLSRDDLNARFGLQMDDAPLLVTFHPVTREYDQTASHVDSLLERWEDATCPSYSPTRTPTPAGASSSSVSTSSSPGGPTPGSFPNLGTQAYFSLLRMARAMVGNSSSGIVEAASFKLPVVNVGNRQQGRTCARNVIQTDCNAEAIAAGMALALSDAFRDN